MMLSFAIQSAAVVAMGILSLFAAHTLDAVSLPLPMPPYPRAPKPIKLVETPHSTRSTATFSNTRVFRPIVEPSRVPAGVRMIDDGPQMLALAPTLAGGAPDGIIGGFAVPGVDGAPVIATQPPAPEKKKDPPAETKRITVGGNVMEAKLVKRVMPVYPPLARQARISGTVRLQGIISRDGQVVNLQVHSGHPLLIATAVEAVRQWVYRPTLLNGQAVEVIAPIDVHFTLSQ